MIISKEKKGEGCGIFIPYFKEICGSWSLKHNEYYYCDECYDKFINLKD